MTLPQLFNIDVKPGFQTGPLRPIFPAILWCNLESDKSYNVDDSLGFRRCQWVLATEKFLTKPVIEGYSSAVELYSLVSSRVSHPSFIRVLIGVLGRLSLLCVLGSRRGRFAFRLLSRRYLGGGQR